MRCSDGDPRGTVRVPDDGLFAKTIQPAPSHIKYVPPAHSCVKETSHLYRGRSWWSHAPQPWVSDGANPLIRVTHTHMTCAHTSVTVQIQSRYLPIHCPDTRRFRTCKVHVERRKRQAMLTLRVSVKLPPRQCMQSALLSHDVTPDVHRCSATRCMDVFGISLQMVCNSVVQRAKIGRITLTSPGPPLDCVNED